MDKILTLEELKSLIKSMKLTRKITKIHIHHTWSPSKKDYTGSNGLALQSAMRNYHVNTNHWSDIGQHLTLLPDGKFVTGRDFNSNPASITNHNTGGFAIEMLGNFDTGNDKLEGNQLNSIIAFCAFLIEHLKLTTDAIIFHREYSTKTCPGTGIDKTKFVNLVKVSMQPVVITPKENISNWAINAVTFVKKSGIMTSDASGKFYPQKAVTREMVAQIIYNTLKYLGKV